MDNQETTLTDIPKDVIKDIFLSLSYGETKELAKANKFFVDIFDNADNDINYWIARFENTFHFSPNYINLDYLADLVLLEENNCLLEELPKFYAKYPPTSDIDEDYSQLLGNHYLSVKDMFCVEGYNHPSVLIPRMTTAKQEDCINARNITQPVLFEFVSLIKTQELYDTFLSIYENRQSDTQYIKNIAYCTENDNIQIDNAQPYNIAYFLAYASPKTYTKRLPYSQRILYGCDSYHVNSKLALFLAATEPIFLEYIHEYQFDAKTYLEIRKCCQLTGKIDTSITMSWMQTESFYDDNIFPKILAITEKATLPNGWYGISRFSFFKKLRDSIVKYPEVFLSVFQDNDLMRSLGEAAVEKEDYQLFDVVVLRMTREYLLLGFSDKISDAFFLHMTNKPLPIKTPNDVQMIREIMQIHSTAKIGALLEKQGAESWLNYFAIGNCGWNQLSNLVFIMTHSKEVTPVQYFEVLKDVIPLFRNRSRSDEIKYLAELVEDFLFRWEFTEQQKYVLRNVAFRTNDKHLLAMVEICVTH